MKLVNPESGEKHVCKFKNRWLSLKEDDGDVWREHAIASPGKKPLPSEFTADTEFFFFLIFFIFDDIIHEQYCYNSSVLCNFDIEIMTINALH